MEKQYTNIVKNWNLKCENNNICKDRKCEWNGYFGNASNNIDCPYCGNSHSLCRLVKPYCVCERRPLEKVDIEGR